MSRVELGLLEVSFAPEEVHLAEIQDELGRGDKEREEGFPNLRGAG